MQIGNKTGVFISGTVSRKAELRTTKNNKLMCKFGVAIGKDESGDSIFVDCQAWQELASYLSDLEKGDSFAGTGRIDTHEYNGKTYKSLVLDWAHSPALATSVPQSLPEVPVENNGKPTFTEVDADEDELPF